MVDMGRTHINEEGEITTKGAIPESAAGSRITAENQSRPNTKYIYLA